jgi:hypothetical protein
MDPRLLAGEDTYRNESGIEGDLCKHHQQEAGILHAEEVEVRWGDLYRADGDPRPGDDYRQSDGDCAPTQLEMEPTITDANQERLSEEQYVPRRNGEAVDKVEAEHDRVDYSAAIAVGAGNEPTEPHEHHHDKSGARGAIEPTISFHFAPGAKFVCPATPLIERLGGVYYIRGVLACRWKPLSWARHLSK